MLFVNQTGVIVSAAELLREEDVLERHGTALHVDDRLVSLKVDGVGKSQKWQKLVFQPSKPAKPLTNASDISCHVCLTSSQRPVSRWSIQGIQSASRSTSSPRSYLGCVLVLLDFAYRYVTILQPQSSSNAMMATTLSARNRGGST